MHPNQEHGSTEDAPEDEVVGEILEEAVGEIKNLLPLLENAFSQIELAAVALRSKELGFNRHSAFWPNQFPTELTYGIAWRDDPGLVAGIQPPPDLRPGWKPDPLYGGRVKCWDGEAWDAVTAPAPVEP